VGADSGGGGGRRAGDPRSAQGRTRLNAPGGSLRPESGIVGIGIDLVQIPRIRRLLERWQDRFLARVFTPDEIAYALGRHNPAEHLAARFAAKEATLKALGTGLSMGVRWREMEVRRARGQRPTLVLTGRTAELGAARGVRALHVSLTHDGDYAMAQVLAEGGPAPAAEPS
jgi:holo-[acyl-carrier protein] synthase